MRIKSLHIDGFGLFNDKSIDGFEKGVNVLYGLNEKGKSTLLDFFRFTLFGYPNFRTDRRPPLRGGNHGGSISLQHSNGSNLSLYRDGNNKIDFSVDGIAADEMRYKQMIGSATKSLYDNVYAITLDELINLSSLQDSGMEDRIFSLGMGINADLGKFEKALREDAEELYLPRGSTQTIVGLQNDIDNVQQKIKILQGNLEEFNENTAALNVAREELKSARKEKEKLEREANRLSGYLNATDAFVKYHRANKDLTAFKNFEQQPKQLMEDYKLQKQRITDNKEDLDAWKREHIALENEKDGIVLVDKFQDKFKFLEALKSTLSLYAANLKSFEKDEELLLEVKQKIDQSLKDLGNEYSLDQVLALQGLKKLDGIAKENEIARTQLEDSLRRNEESDLRIAADLEYEEKQLEEKRQQLSTSPIKNEQDLEVAKTKKIKLKTEYESALSGDAVAENNFQRLAIWGAVLVLLIAAVVLWSNNSILTAGLAILIAVVLAVSKVVGNKDKTDKSDGRALLKINEEKEDVDSQIADYENNLRVLKSAEEKYNRLNEEVRQQKTLNEKSKTELQELEQQWEAVLQQHGLSGKLLPRNVEGFLNVVHNLQEKKQQQERYEKELEKKGKEIKVFQAKVLEIDEKQSTSVEAVKLLVDQMDKAFEKKKDKAQKQIASEQKLAEIKGLEKKIESFENELKEKLDQIGVADELAFYKHFEKQETYEELIKQKRDAIDNIQIHCGREEQFEQAIEILKKHSKAEFELQLKDCNNEIEVKTKFISETDNRIGELTSDGNKLLKEKDLLALQNKREVLLVQYEDAVKKWVTHRMAMEVLNESKKQYEKDKQPEVIHHTKRYFQAITNNAYRDLRISLSERKVEVINDAGKSKSVEELSRGTREQLLLALRMGLIEEYETTVEPLPLALDDVMVNFDNPRAERLAEVLTDFAKDRQVLLFTCHEHSRDLFKAKSGQMLNW